MKLFLMAMALLLSSNASAVEDSALNPLAPNTSAQFPHARTPEGRIFRGSIVFQNYCILCHGVNADGKGRAAKLYNPKPANLVLSDKNDQYIELIVRKGGGAIGRSEFMPPWSNELTNEQIDDVIGYLRSMHQ